ncbi:MAG: glycosyltransferase [Bacteroidales bacterium]|nr:glycosyltransferase [Bacteroidales bacterium]
MGFFFDQYPFLIGICMVALLALLVQLFCYLYYYGSVWFQSRRAAKNKIVYTDEEVPVSVIVYAEYLEELQQTLPAILQQQYSDFEVIVVNDGNGSQVYDYVSILQNDYPNLYHTYVPLNAKYISRKKLALTIGIKAARNEWVMLTNAGCLPSSSLWIKSMSRNFLPQTDLVLGYSNFKSRHSLISRFIAFDGMMDALQYLGRAIHHSAYKGDGRNMAFRKELFFRQEGFKGHLDLISGEDDLFVSSITTPKNTRVECSSDSLISEASVNLTLWANFKQKYAASSRYYKRSASIIALIRNSSMYLFYASFIILIVSGFTSGWVFSVIGSLLFLIRYSIQQFVIEKSSSLLQERSCYFTIMLFELLTPLCSIYFRLRRSSYDFTWKI